MTVRIGVIGTGAIGRDHARRINKVLGGAKVVALSDVNPASAEAVKNDIAPDAVIFATGEELIASPDVDAVLITSWGATHEQYVLAAIAAGKPCFAKSRWRQRRKGQSASLTPRWRRASGWFRWASCAVMTPVMWR